MTSLIGVFREPEYSPGRVDDDAAILERTRDALASRGVALHLGGIELLEHAAPTAVLAMCQSASALLALDRIAATRIVNRPDAIRACHRRETVRRLGNTNVPFPATRIVDTAGPLSRIDDVTAPCWVKRGDVHAMASDDVVFAPNADAVAIALADFAARGIVHAALQAHVDGVVVKFYGVADGRFFRCFTEHGTVPAALPALWDAAHAGAAALGLEVFGGDLVVSPDGRPVIIDLNDWPSFARCRDEAADAIAGYVVEHLLEAPLSAQGHHG
jgi:hypothetical protein